MMVTIIIAVVMIPFPPLNPIVHISITLKIGLSFEIWENFEGGLRDALATRVRAKQGGLNRTKLKANVRY